MPNYTELYLVRLATIHTIIFDYSLSTSISAYTVQLYGAWRQRQRQRPQQRPQQLVGVVGARAWPDLCAAGAPEANANGNAAQAKPVAHVKVYPMSYVYILDIT